MVVTAALGQGTTRPAEVVYPPFAAAKGSAWRDGDECYLKTSLLQSWGWNVEASRDRATVTVGGNPVTVPVRTFGQDATVALRGLLTKLGGASAWRPSEDTLEVWSIVRTVSLRNGALVVETGLPCRPKISVDQQPSALAVDLLGARKDSATRIDAPSEVRLTQETPFRLRLTVPCQPGVMLPSWRAETTRRFELDIAAVLLATPPASTQVTSVPGDARARPAIGADQNAGAKPTPAIEPPKQDPPKQDPPVTEPPKQEVPPTQTPPVTQEIAQGGLQGPPVPTYEALPWRVQNETATGAALIVPFRGRALQAPVFSRPDLETIELRLFGAKPGSPRDGQAPFQESPSLAGAETIEDDLGILVRFKTVRPFGVEFSVVGNEYVVRLVKPRTGDGRLAGKVVVIDPGHGGDDPGARNPADQTFEKNLTLAVGMKAAQRLTEAGATVLMTRRSDVFIGLRERSEVANRNAADFFVSIHINSNARPNSTSGTISFYHLKDPIGRLLAECMQSELAKVTGLPDIGVWSDGRIYSSGFAVLRHSQVPATLLELGFINHQRDRSVMRTERFQDSVAEAIVRGLKVYLGDGEGQ
ncbi:MAG: N-acetylmuramoyl-L-alanine amidase [Fimbriimonadaceae bacterium]|nr:N-acetylmuramoyl-L-alanine amidase [Fimbriimonadaceae bacterium]